MYRGAKVSLLKVIERKAVMEKFKAVMENFKSITIILLSVVGFLAVSDTTFAENPMRITTEENIISVHTGDSVLLRYHYGDVPFKPCVQELFSPRYSRRAALTFCVMRLPTISIITH